LAGVYAVWESLRRTDDAVGNYAELFGSGKTVECLVPTIGRTIADEYGAEHADVGVGVRADENDSKTIEKRDGAMTDMTLKVQGATESVLLIVGEAYRAARVYRLRIEPEFRSIEEKAANSCGSRRRFLSRVVAAHCSTWRGRALESQPFNSMSTKI
jgi:hypothetical protein